MAPFGDDPRLKNGSRVPASQNSMEYQMQNGIHRTGTVKMPVTQERFRRPKILPLFNTNVQIQCAKK